MPTQIIIDSAATSIDSKWRPRGFTALLLLASATLHGNAVAVICTGTGTDNWNEPATSHDGPLAAAKLSGA